MSNWQKCRVLSQNIQNNAKLQKWSKYNDFASIWCQNIQNNAKLQKWSKYNDLNRFDVELAKIVEFCHKTFKTTQNSKSDQSTMTSHRFDVKMIKTTQNYQIDQITMNCMHLTSNWQKCRVLSQIIQNNGKLQKWSKYNDLNRFDVELAKMSSFVTKHSKQRINQKWSKHNDFASIWCQNDQNNAKLPNRSNYDELHGFDVELEKMSSFVTKHSKQRKTPKVIKVQWLCIDLMSKWSKQRKSTKAIKLRWIACIWCRIGKNVEFCYKTFKTTQNSKSDQNTMTWIDLMSNWHKCRVLSQNIQNNAKLQKWSKYNDLNRFDVELAKMSSFVTKHSKQRINQKWSKHNDFASIWCQNDQNNAKLPNRSNYDELHGFDVELEKMSSFVTKHSKQRKTPKVIKVQWLCIDLMSKWSKQRKSTKAIKLRWIACIWCRIGKNVEFCYKTFKTTQNSKSDQNTMTWIDLMSNWQKCRVLSQNIQNNAKLQKWSKYNDLNRFDVELAKMSSFVTKHSKQRKNQKWSKHNDFASIWCQNDQNNAKVPKRSNYDELHAFDVELAKMSSFVTKHSKQRKTPKVIKIQWLKSIWCRIGKNVEFCHKTFKTTQNSKSDQSTMTLHRFDVKTFKTTQNSKSDQNTMTWIDLMSNWQKLSSFVTKHSKQRKTPKVIKVQWLCIDLMSKWSKQRKTTKLIKLRWIACIWRRIGKNVEFCHKSFKTTQNSKSDQNTMTWIDLMSNWQKCRVLSQNIQNNA